ncbi:MAG: 3-dehydroquinate synthase [Planctomycetes bacterium GWF2_50_10]|nr:MAG: 3-dehydroquinate synthase [Planctomycetes bacterium GWF2_50_10]
MKKLWVNLVPFNKNIATTALESGAEAVVISDTDKPRMLELGLIKLVCDSGDIQPNRDVVFIDINSKNDEKRAAAVSCEKIVVLTMLDWTIIPIENLLAARKGPVFVRVTDSSQAKLMVEILEKGVDGVLLDTTDMNELIKTAAIVTSVSEKIELIEASVTSVRQLGMGDRACLDTCTQMNPGQGMLIGNTSTGFFLVHSESIDNPYVASRPFRVNAGAVHAYAMIPGQKTKYLADLKTGDEVMVVDSKGNTSTAYLGRSKIEKRPLMLVEAKYKTETISLVLQNAETIRLVRPSGDPVSITSLKPGDTILAHVEQGGRHFGMKVEETLIER